MLGNIRFIGELYKQKMLTEKIMHECLIKLLGDIENPEEDVVECLCVLMSTIGQAIDHGKGRRTWTRTSRGCLTWRRTRSRSSPTGCASCCRRSTSCKNGWKAMASSSAPSGDVPRKAAQFGSSGIGGAHEAPSDSGR